MWRRAVVDADSIAMRLTASCLDTIDQQANPPIPAGLTCDDAAEIIISLGMLSARLAIVLAAVLETSPEQVLASQSD